MIDASPKPNTCGAGCVKLQTILGNQDGSRRHLGTHSLFPSVTTCAALHAGEMLPRGRKGKIPALEDLRASKQRVTREGGRYPPEHLLITHQLPGNTGLRRPRWMNE